MLFTHYTIYLISIFALFVSNNPTLCHIYNHSAEKLIDSHLFYTEPSRTAFSLDVEPLRYPDKCKLVQLHLNQRHGDRYPDPNDIIAYEELETVFADVPVAREFYKNVFPMSSNYRMTRRGELAMFYDGITSRKRYAEFWGDLEYDPAVINFRSTATSRTGASAMAFSLGLFNGKGSLDTCKIQPVYIESVPLEQDDILAPHRACPRWVNTIAANNTVLESQLYEYGNTTLARIANRLTNEYGISPPLEPRLLPYMFTYCEYWVVVYNRTDTWCSLFSLKELTLLRYHWDLYGYYVLQYGNPFTKRISCRYITRLVNGVEDYLSGKSLVIADLNDSHGFSMLLTLTLLGLFREEFPLTADLPYELIESLRYTENTGLQWTSMLYFEIYTCSDKGNNSVKIRATLNYKPLVIPGCGDEYCDWERFKELFSEHIGCDFEGMCAYP